MKKFSVICGLALAMLAAGCSKDATTDINPITKTTLSVSLDQTRTYLGEAVDGVAPILWSEGDAVAINGVSTTIAAEYVGQPAAAFTGVVAADDYSVFYPASLLDATSVGKNVYTIPTVQQFVEGSFAPNTSILVGYAEHNDVKTSVALKNVYGYLKITLTNAANVKKVYVSATADEAISGTFEIDYKTAAITPLAGQSIIRVMGIQATAGVATVVVAVPAGEYAEGFTVKAIDSSNKAMVKTIGKTAGVEIERAQLYTLPSLAYVASADAEVEITTASELQEFLSAIDEGDYSAWVNAKGEVVLGNDIDLADYELTATTVPFTGVFNGQGYALKNWTTSRGLFTESKGTVKNVVIDASCKLNVTNTGTGKGGDQNVGFIVENNGVTGIVSGCVNNGDVTVDDVSLGGHRIGGLSGVSYGRMINCTNNGDVVVTGSTVTNNMQIGGVVGYVNANASTKDALGTDLLLNCINNGKVDVLFDCLPKVVNVGGVSGATQQTKISESTPVWQGTLKNCFNTGDVSYHFTTLNSGTYANVGGIIGYSQASIDGCENSGAVKYTTPIDDTTVAGTRPATGGIVGCTLYSVINCTNYGAVTVAGLWVNGTAGNASAGAMGTGVFGGVVGCAALSTSASTTDYEVKNCANYGKLNIKHLGKDACGSATYMGGVVGYAKMPVSYCYNYGDTYFGARLADYYFGGVVGWASEAVSYCETHSDELTMELIENTTADRSNNYFGGVVGLANKGVTYCNNLGKVTNINISSLPLGLSTLYAAGVVGRSYVTTSYCNNSSATTINTPSAESTSAVGTYYTGGVIGYSHVVVTNCTLNAPYTLKAYNASGSIRCAGIVGQVVTLNNASNTYSISDCETTNKASVTCITDNVKNSYTAGIIGNCNDGLQKCTNNAAVTLNVADGVSVSTTNIYHYFGGVAGTHNWNMDDCHNNGLLTIDFNDCNENLVAGSLSARIGKAAGFISECSNTGNMVITNASSRGASSAIGNGLAGFVTEGATQSNNTDSGTITIDGETL